MVMIVSKYFNSAGYQTEVSFQDDSILRFLY